MVDMLGQLMMLELDVIEKNLSILNTNKQNRTDK